MPEYEKICYPSERKTSFVYSKVDLKKQLANLKAIVLYIQFLFICHFHGTLFIKFWGIFPVGWQEVSV